MSADYTCPTCEKCGAPLTTGAMALLCPGREECAFWPEEGISDEFAAMFPDKYTAEDKARFRAYCAARAAQGLPHFAPRACFSCGNDIYADKHTAMRAVRELITGCPHCHRSFVE